jgi:hypothetical protein
MYEQGPGNSDAYSLETIPRHFERCEFMRGNGLPRSVQYRFGPKLGPDFRVDQKGDAVEQEP